MGQPFCTSGPVPPDSPAYVERETDHQLRRCLLAMDWVLLSAPRQMGKTSLIHRLQAQLAESGYATIYIDVRRSEHWELLTLLQTLAKRAEDTSERMIVALDELNGVPESLLHTLKGLLIARRAEPRLGNLAFILAGEFAGRILPIREVALKDFYRPHVRQLVDLLGAEGDLAEAITDRVYYWTGGHPYLTQKMCSLLAEGDLPLTAKSTDQAARRIWEEDAAHIPYVLEKLDAVPKAGEQLERILRGEKVRFNPASELAIIGVVKDDGYGHCVVRNRIYEKALVASGRVKGPRST